MPTPVRLNWSSLANSRSVKSVQPPASAATFEPMSSWTFRPAMGASDRKKPERLRGTLGLQTLRSLSSQED